MGDPSCKQVHLGLKVPKVSERALNRPLRMLNHSYMVVSLNYCSQNGGNLYRAPYYNGNPNIGPRIIGNLDQSLYG